MCYALERILHLLKAWITPIPPITFPKKHTFLFPEDDDLDPGIEERRRRYQEATASLDPRR